MRVRRREGPDPVAFQTPPRPVIVIAPPSPYKDALYSVGKTVGWGILTCFQLMLWQAFRLAVSLVKKQKEEPKAETSSIPIGNLYIIPKFKALLAKDPYTLFMMLLDLFDKDPGKVEEILTNIGGNYHKNLSAFSPYVKDAAQQKAKRKELVDAFQGIIEKCILTPEEQAIREKVSNGDFDEIADAKTSNSVWAADKQEKVEEEIDLMQKAAELQKQLDAFNKFWAEKVLKNFTKDPHFDDLALKSKSEAIKAFANEKDISLASFIELHLFRMDGSPHNPRKLGNLAKQKNLEEWAEVSLLILTIFRSGDISPRIHQLCDRLLLILSVPEKRTRLFDIVSNIVRIFRPNQ